MKDLFQVFKDNELTPNGYYLLYCIENNVIMDLNLAYSTEVHRLKLQGFLDDKSELTEKGIKVMNATNGLEAKKVKGAKEPVSADFKQNLSKYRELFPATKDAGRPVRSTIVDLEPRMQWFFRSYPEYTWEMVLNATRKYIESQSGDYKYCMTSAYFIKKDDKNRSTLSTLATWCEAENDEQSEPNNPFVGFNRLV
jgi:hypothetical protein